MDRAGRSILGDPAGAGKTATTLRWLADSGAARSLVVAPADLVSQWVKESELWTPELTVINGMGNPNQRALARSRFQTERQSVLAINYETLRGDVEELETMDLDAFVADEAHRLKERDTAVTKSTRRVAKRADYMGYVTYTPLLNRAEEIFPLLQLMAPSKYRSFWRWAHERFYIETTDFNHTVPQPVTLILGLRPGAAEVIHAELDGALLHRESSLGLPPAIAHTVNVALSPEEQAAWDSFQEHSWMQIGHEIIQAPNAVAYTTRARQLASDWSGLVQSGVSAGAKVTKASELLRGELADEQVVVGVQFKAAALALAAAFPGDALTYTGDKSRKKRLEAKQSFIDGNARILIGTQATMGEGVDGLQVANNLITLDRDWTPARNDQFIARERRRGQTKQVHVWNIYAEGTVDEDVADTNSAKETVIESVLKRKAA